MLNLFIRRWRYSKGVQNKLGSLGMGLGFQKCMHDDIKCYVFTTK